MWVLLVFATMETATQEGGDFGSEGNKKNKIDDSVLKDHPVLSDKKDEKPSMTTPNSDAEEMMVKRSDACRKGDKIQGDVLVGDLLKAGDQCVSNPSASLTMTTNTSSTAETIVDCAESVKTIEYQTLYFFRNLQLDIFHQDKIEKKYCHRRIKRCTSWWGSHGDDSTECDTYKWVDGPTVEIEPHRSCSSLGWRYYDTEERTVQYEKTELNGEKWVIEDPHRVFEKVRGNVCNLGKTECVKGPETRCFYGKGFPKDCWRQQVAVLCPVETPETNTCAELRKKGCHQLSEHCVKSAANGQCVKWEKRYRCPAQSSETINCGHDKIHNIDGGSLVGKSEQFNDMAGSLTQLQVLSEMKKDVQNITSLNQKITAFKGQCNRCKKNICENVLYDCCAIQGLAMDLNLVRCNPEERQLAVMRAEGKCHYVGCTPNQFMGMWTSSDTHVYCCYPSPLIAYLQKEARKQLGKGFGTPQSPDCEGLSMDEIGRVDFSKMDLSPVFEDVLRKARTNKSGPDLSNVKERMEQKVKDLKLDIPPRGYGFYSLDNNLSN